MAAAAADKSGESHHPRMTYRLEGHDRVEQAFLEALGSARMHHAWMLTGPRGIGKASLAYRVARRVLGAEPNPAFGLLGASPDDPVCRAVEAGSHADLCVLERPWDEAKGKRRGEIPVDQARAARAFFASTAGQGGWRVCVIDAVDEMNANAANAILKTLEEPPPRALVLLVAHAPGRTLATIRSRCRTLRLAAPGEAVAARVAAEAAGCDGEEASALAALAEGRPGAAVSLAQADGRALNQRLLDAMSEAGAVSDGGALADTLAARGGEDARAAFFELLAAHVRRRAREASDGAAAERLAEAWRTLADLERSLDGLHLDPKLGVLEALRVAREAGA